MKALILFVSIVGVVGCGKLPAPETSSRLAVGTDAPAVSANPAEVLEADQASKTGLLPYRVLERNDISYPGRSRMTCRVLVEAATIPTKDALREIATSVWRDGNQNLDDFTVFAYLPGMDARSAAYAIVEFTSSGAKGVEIQDFALIGTKWRDLDAEAAAADEAWRETKQAPGVRDYKFTLSVARESGRAMAITLQTSLPDGAVVRIGVSRHFRQRGRTETYAGEICSEEHVVSGGQVQVAVNVNDSPWRRDHEKKVERFAGLDVVGEIAEVDDDVVVRALFTPRAGQPREIAAVLGANGEYIRGPAASRTANFTVLEAEERLTVPYEK